jgi:phage terminase large subunit GpA-like protein
MKFATDYAADLTASWNGAFAPDRAATLWEWSTTCLVLPDSETSSLGSFSSKRASPFRRIHDVIASRKMKRAVNLKDPHAWRCEQLWVCWSAQCGKTVSTAYPAFSWMARYYPHQPAAFFWPTIDVKKAQVRDRLEPLWQATPDLADLMPVPGTEDYARRIGDRTWRLGNGLRAGLRVGNIANDLRANPYCNIFFDEFDALKLNVGDQGDPLRLAIDRQRTFGPDALVVGVTTPSTVEAHGWRKLCDGTHERLMIACTACQGLDWVNPDQVRPVTTVELPSPTPQDIFRGDLAAWVCRHCGVMHRTDSLRMMVDDSLAADRWIDGDWTVDDDHPRGFWSPSLDLDDQGRFRGGEWPIVDSEIRSIHGNILMTDVWTIGKFLTEELAALSGSEDDRKTHWNTARAEPYFPNASRSATLDERNALHEKTRIRGEVPAEAKYLVLMLDQQGNTERLCWFPWVLRAFAPGGESWLVDTGKIPKAGAGAEPGGFVGVDALAGKAWKKAGGGVMIPNIVCMDGANGVMAQRVRVWAAQNPKGRMLTWGAPRLGHDEPWRLYEPGKRSKIPWPTGVKGFAINSNYWRDRVDERRRQVVGAPGWWLPEEVPGYYLKSVWDSEVRVVVQRQVTGQGMREVIAWEPAASTDGKTTTYRRDNHWWDCEVSLAAIANIFGIDKSEAIRSALAKPRRYRSGKVTTKEA